MLEIPQGHSVFFKISADVIFTEQECKSENVSVHSGKKYKLGLI